MPTPFAAIDGHDDLAIAGRMVGGIVENEEIRSQLADGHDVSVDAELHADNRGMPSAV